MSVQLTPSKRPPHERSPRESNGKGKLQKHSQNQSVSVFRVLCPASRTGSVIGKGGSIISRIRKEAGAKIRVEETVPGCDERVISIMRSDKEIEVNVDHGKEDDGVETGMAKEGDDTSEHANDDEKDGKDEHQESGFEEDSRNDKESAVGKATSSVQRALLLVFERMVEGESETDVGNEEASKSTFSLRLLVFSSQVGCLLGKGGSVIKQMSSESGAQIRLLPRDKLPSCASSSDELIQITGTVDEVRKALRSISQQLLENPPRENDSLPANPGLSLSHSFIHRPESFGGGLRMGSDYDTGVPPLIPKFHEGGRMRPTPEILSFRLLCPDDKVGGVIGKGGTIVRTIQQDTGCEIKVLDCDSDSDERVIVVSGPAHPDDRISAPQEAVLRVQAKVMKASPDSKDKSLTARLLVSSNQIGCLLGKGGSIIAEMRKLSGAHIRVLGKDQIPKCASENEEVVQVNGDLETVHEALMQITTRLRNHFFRDAFPSINYPSAFPDHIPPFPSYMGRRELSPPGMFSNLGPSFHKFDAVGGLPSHGGFQPHEDRPPFMHRPGVPPHMPEGKPWGLQGLYEGGGPLGLQEFSGASQRRFSGFGGGSQPAIITNTTVEVVVPRSVVPAIYGEDGGCLKQIRQISDAKIVINEPKPGASETVVIVISGTPEQTSAAQSLIQAFVLIESEST